MIRVTREGANLWTILRAPDNTYTVCTFDELPPDVRDKVAVLMTAQIGYRHEQVGRRVANDIFWVFQKKGVHDAEEE